MVKISAYIVTLNEEKRLGKTLQALKEVADEIFVINPGGYIGESTWSEICYTSMLGKNIRYMEPIKSNEVAEMVQSHISRAEELAIRQLDE